MNSADILYYPVKGYERYKISEYGDILSIRGKIMSFEIRNNNRKVIKLRNNNSYITISIHLLVATTFIENINNHEFIKFIDGNSMNVHKINLEWTDNPYGSLDLWEPLKNYTKYEISINNIRNATNKKSIKPHEDRDGYLIVNLTNNEGKNKQKAIHILIANQWIPNPLNLPQVNHKNGDKKDYNLQNLEWVTPSQNVQHAIDTGLLDVKKGR